ncbi:MAG: DUF952 domain-containing protein [Bacteroidota bacterium]|nr:DUF952 domain-containing protein [Bacteroidota bacterium]
MSTLKLNKNIKYKGEEIKAFCYIYKVNDESNKCLLTDQHLFVILKNSEHSFPLIELSHIQLENRYSMFPLIAGGILLPFTLIAIFKYLYDPWILIYLFILGALSFYMGWIGKPVISINSKNSISDTLLIKYVSEPLKAFINFTNETIKAGVQDELNFPSIYHIISTEEWEFQKNSGKPYSPPSLSSEGFIHCSQKEQLAHTVERFFKDKKGILILTINPLKVKAEIKFEPAKDAPGLFPHIYGPLNLDAVAKAALWEN